MNVKLLKESNPEKFDHKYPLRPF